jgi:hypothetical protein
LGIGLLVGCLLGPVLLAGCEEPQTPRQVYKVPLPRQALAVTQPVYQYPPAQAAAPPQPAAVAQQPAAPPPALVVPQQVAAAPAAGGQEEASEPPAEARPARPAPSHRGEEAPARKSFSDITAHSSFGHAEDYGWLSGEVEYSRISKGWRLRYASVDEEDRYGGSVTLGEHPLLHGLKDGQYVRVTGRLGDTGQKSIAPPYLIDSLQPLSSTAGADQPAESER